MSREERRARQQREWSGGRVEAARTEVNIHEAKTHLSKLWRRVLAGEQIVVAKGGWSIARLVPYDQATKRQFGADRGLFEAPDDFDAPLDPETLASFEP